MDAKQWNVLSRGERLNVLTRLGLRKVKAQDNAKLNFDFLDEDVKTLLTTAKLLAADLITTKDLKLIMKEELRREQEKYQPKLVIPELKGYKKLDYPVILKQMGLPQEGINLIAKMVEHFEQALRAIVQGDYARMLNQRDKAKEILDDILHPAIPSPMGGRVAYARIVGWGAVKKEAQEAADEMFKAIRETLENRCSCRGDLFKTLTPADIKTPVFPARRRRRV